GVSSATRAFKKRRDVGIAEDKVQNIEQDVAELEAELAEEIGELEEKFDVNNTRLDTESIKPYKKDIDIKSVSLIWLPYDQDNKPAW
ncbi:hypothetical protein N9956_05210, partial [Akkermansiaceae bacterium]|nr:hypothetical protein [Akkermansiaceae bacterium]